MHKTTSGNVVIRISVPESTWNELCQSGLIGGLLPNKLAIKVLNSWAESRAKKRKLEEL